MFYPVWGHTADVYWYSGVIKPVDPASRCSTISNGLYTCRLTRARRGCDCTVLSSNGWTLACPSRMNGNFAVWNESRPWILPGRTRSASSVASFVVDIPNVPVSCLLSWTGAPTYIPKVDKKNWQYLERLYRLSENLVLEASAGRVKGPVLKLDWEQTPQFDPLICLIRHSCLCVCRCIAPIVACGSLSLAHLYCFRNTEVDSVLLGRCRWSCATPRIPPIPGIPRSGVGAMPSNKKQDQTIPLYTYRPQQWISATIVVVVIVHAKSSIASS